MKAALNPPAAVRKIARTLEAAGFETWCVGGAVRDAMLGHAHLDWDLATAARPKQMRSLFARTVPVGIAFGTVGVLDDHDVMHEVTTFRRDVHTDGRHAVVDFGATLEEDLARRDYTINAIAYSPKTKELRDPFHGQKDLERKIEVLHSKIHSGAYRALPSRRSYIPKEDGSKRPLAITALEDKIVQRATAAVLSAIYEEDFLGFSYGFRPGRGTHDAMDALLVGSPAQR